MPTVAEIDEEISRLNARLIDLKKQRNTLVAVGFFPEEIIAAVFDSYFYQVGADDGSLGQTTYLRYLHPIMHTCTMWRSVAKNCRILWSVIHQDPLPIPTDWIIQQGRNVPLRVLADVFQRGLPPGLQDHTSRIVELGSHRTPLACQHPSFLPLIELLARARAESLKIFAVYGFANARAPSDATIGHITMLLEDAKRSLQQLHLSHAGLSWVAMPCFTNLESLYASPLAVEDNVLLRNSLRQLSISCPSLHTLILGDPIDTDQPFLRRETITFPALQRFGSAFGPNRTRFLAETLVLPPNCRARVLLYCDDPDFVSTEYFHTAIATIQPLLHGQTFGSDQRESAPEFSFHSAYLSLDVDRITFTAYEVEQYGYMEPRDAQPDFNDVDCAGRSGWPCVHVSLTIPNVNNDGRAMTQLLRAVSAADIKTLDIWVTKNWANRTTPHAFRNSLLGFANLASLRVSHLSGKTLQDHIIVSLLRAIGALDDFTVVMPKLRRLVIEDVNDNYEQYGDQSDSLNVMEVVWITALWRAQLGAPLDQMQLRTCKGAILEVYSDARTYGTRVIPPRELDHLVLRDNV